MLPISENLSLEKLPPLSLYVHVPWCVRKCPYCDFNSHQLRGEIDEFAYVSALLADLQTDLPLLYGRMVQSIFIGGGTPSLLSGEAILRLLNGVRGLLNLSPVAEITLEANPAVAEQEKFFAFRDAGVNRLSLGIQSFNDQHLQELGRIHNADEAWRAIELAQEIFEQVNLDLMYALPAQTLVEAQSDIDAAITSNVGHISAYHLTLEANTAFAVTPPINLPDEDLAADMQCALEDSLAKAGFSHYETSAFARGASCCQHNLNYWQFGDYLGIGAGAHSKLSTHDKIERSMRYKQPSAYLAAIQRGDARQTRHQLTKSDVSFEFMMNALRLSDGFSTDLFYERTSMKLDSIAQAVQQAKEQGLIEQSVDKIRPTLHGQRFLNDLLALFLP